MYLLCTFWTGPDEVHQSWSEAARKNLWSFEYVDWLKSTNKTGLNSCYKAYPKKFALSVWAPMPM